MSDIKPFAFVLMPFSEDFKDIYNLGIKAVANDLGVVAERIDEQHYSESVLERIYRQIDTCDFIIADMTGQNPNVFYEVGYAHAKSKLCALITKNANDIPFDLKHHTHIIYDGSISDLQKQLAPKIQWMKEECEKKKVETISFSLRVSGEILTKDDYSAIGSMELRLNLKNNSRQRSPEIEAIYVTTRDSWKVTQLGRRCAFESAEKNTKRHLITPNLSRLSPGAFSETVVEMEKTYWRKYDGGDAEDSYDAKGNLIIEIVTSEGTFRHEKGIHVVFDEIPF